ncbi:hypothetical protein GCM10027589_17250 [Actinocorallia lasiicapitis]
MNDAPYPQPTASNEEAFTRRTVTSILAGIAALTFLFSFGNIWALGRRLGVEPWIAPLVGPAVDLSVIGLLVAVRYLALRGVSPNQLRQARALLVFSGLTTLALNTAEPTLRGEYGRAAFDAVGPLLLIGWSEVGPGLLREIHRLTHAGQAADRDELSLVAPGKGAALQKAAWRWAQDQQREHGALPDGAAIGAAFDRSARWGRLTKRAGLEGKFDRVDLVSA